MSSQPIVESVYEQACVRCSRPIDLLSATWCECLSSERTFACNHCGGCACDSSATFRNKFWMDAPPALWMRRRDEKGASKDRLLSLKPQSVSRPFALVIDDDPQILAVARRILIDAGFTTLTTHKPEDAREIAFSLRPDLILTDALMPRLDGRELCRQLKTDPRSSRTVIIVMTSLYKGTIQRNEAFKTFLVDEYLEKPVRRSLLEAAIERLLPQHTAQRVATA